MDTLRRGVCCALLVVAFAACGYQGCGSQAPPPPKAPVAECNADAETAQVWGPWVVTWTGVRDGCEDERINGREYTAVPGLEIEVSQKPNDAGPDELLLAQSLDGVLYSGSVEGDCVRFEIVLGEGVVSMGLSGTADENEIRGRFRGVGPGTCTATGSFEAKVRQASLRW